MSGLRDAGQHRDIAFVPVAQLDERGDVATRVDLHLLRADYTPSPFGLHRAHRGERGRIAIAHAVAVRHLVEAVFRSHRSDADRLEEYVVSWIAHDLARQCISSISSRSSFRMRRLIAMNSGSRTISGFRGRGMSIRISAFTLPGRAVITMTL